MIAILIIIVVFLVLVCGILYRRVEFLTDGVGDDVAHEHAKCMSMVAAFVGDEFAARVLESAAHDYDSLEEQGEMKVLARAKFIEDGPSMPAIWMQDRADKLRSKTHDTETVVEYTFSGERLEFPK